MKYKKKGWKRETFGGKRVKGVVRDLTAPCLPLPFGCWNSVRSAGREFRSESSPLDGVLVGLGWLAGWQRAEKKVKPERFLPNRNQSTGQFNPWNGFVRILSFIWCILLWKLRFLSCCPFSFSPPSWRRTWQSGILPIVKSKKLPRRVRKYNLHLMLQPCLKRERDQTTYPLSSTFLYLMFQLPADVGLKKKTDDPKWDTGNRNRFWVQF